MMIKLQAIYKNYLWGGRKLATDFGKQCNGEILAESWELSCHPDGLCTIANGPYAGNTLLDYVTNHPEVLGENCKKYKTFPILIKLIDAKQSLSIQVHPDDDYANEVEGDNGKNEMWYIVDATKDAFIYYGFNQSITKEAYRERIANGTLLAVLNKVSVKKGEHFFIKAGTVHAIGAGCLIAEVQQSSNVTYRVYDFDRRDANGNLRELHIDKAIAVSALSKPVQLESNSKLVESKYFTTEKVEVTGTPKHYVATNQSFHALLVVEGSGFITCGSEAMPLHKGETLFISANSGTYTLTGTLEALLTYMDY